MQAMLLENRGGVTKYHCIAYCLLGCNLWIFDNKSLTLIKWINITLIKLMLLISYDLFLSLFYIGLHLINSSDDVIQI